MTRRPWMVAAALAVIVIVAVASWIVVQTRDDGDGYTGLSAEEMLSRVQSAIAERGSYRVAISGHNLVLPQWGGIDSGVVDVSLAGPVANASLQRTGDGLYKIRLVDGQTYFQRITCDTLARVPGGGSDVLAPFMLSGLSLTSRDTGQVIDDAGGPPIIGVTVPRLGPVALEFDPDSYLPVHLEKVRVSPDEGESEWEFSDWGEAVDVDAPPGDVADRGPGGNPC